MRSQVARTTWTALLLAASIAADGASGTGGNPLAFGKPDFDFTGTVYDDVTRKPMEGAYVVAIYRQQVVGMDTRSGPVYR